jgi:3-oxoacyl-[acyl-carrier-protein] synthase III
MRFERVALASVEYVLPEERVRSEELEARLAPLYERLRLREGRLELMTGIVERRFFPERTRPSAVAARAGRLALDRSAVADRVALLIHASVCRDFLEPATASVVHHALGLKPECAAFDLSNACLGFANALLLVAQQIESGAIDAGLVVSGECGRPLVEQTIRALLDDPAADKAALKAAFASLTIGSGAAAAVLTRTDLAPGAPRLTHALARAATEHHVLCHGDHVGGGMLMQTDSEALMHAGAALARTTFEEFLRESSWTRASIQRVVTHQVGVAHRKLVLGHLGLDLALDYPTVETLGNIGSVSLPLSFARARESGFIAAGQRVAMCGIGSGLHCLILGVET